MLAREGNLVLGGREFFLQCEEVLIGLQVRVVLYHGENAAKGRCEHIFRLRLFADGARGNRVCARLRYILKQFLLVRGIPLDRVDQVRDEVIAALQLHVNLCPGLVHPVTQAYQPVKDADKPQAEQDKQSYHHDEDNYPRADCGK